MIREIQMPRTPILLAACCLFGTASVFAQNPPGPLRQGPGVPAAQDARYESVIAQCKNPPPAQAAGVGGNVPRVAEGNTVDRAYTVTAIPGVIAAGSRWQTLWETDGNNADGIMGTDDGGLLIAQADLSQVIRLDPSGSTTVVYRDTNTGGSVAMSKGGQVFVASRGLNPAVLQLAPERKILANRYQGDTLDCISRGVLNDISADAKGGVYFTMGSLFHANPEGEVTRYGENLRTNGVILSADEKTLYVTNAGTLVAFDVEPDGSLVRQRDFATLPGGGGDGGAVDTEGRVYTTGPSGVHVIAAGGTHLGVIPAPRGLVSIAFGGPGKQTLFAVASIRPPEGGFKAAVMSIPLLSTGYKGRAK